MANLVVKNPTAINNYHGITIYNICKNNNFDEGVLEYWFTLEEYGTFDDESSFDVRDIKGFDASLTISANLVKFIDDEVFGETNLIERESSDCEDFFFVADGDAKDMECPICKSPLQDSNPLAIDDEQREYASQSFNCANCNSKIKSFYRLCLEFHGVE